MLPALIDDQVLPERRDSEVRVELLPPIDRARSHRPSNAGVHEVPKLPPDIEAEAVSNASGSHASPPPSSRRIAIGVAIAASLALIAGITLIVGAAEQEPAAAPLGAPRQPVDAASPPLMTDAATEAPNDAISD